MLTGMEAGFQCAACGEWNSTVVDESAGSRQRYVEDCQVCCQPIEISYTAENEGVIGFEARVLE